MSKTNEFVKSIAERFVLSGDILEIHELGKGNINDTFLVTCKAGDGTKRYVLQRLNTQVFKEPEKVMENSLRVTDHLRKQEKPTQGGDRAVDSLRSDERTKETLQTVRAGENSRTGGQPYETLTYVQVKEDQKQAHYEGTRTEDQTCLEIAGADNGRVENSLANNYLFTAGPDQTFRMTEFLEKTYTRERAENLQEVREHGRAFGAFLRVMNGFPAETLHETIPGFHDTRARFDRFAMRVESLRKAASEQENAHIAGERSCEDTEEVKDQRRADAAKTEENERLPESIARLKECEQEIGFLLQNEAFSDYFRLHPQPLRVTHNDTKIANMLFDAKTQKGRAVIDLDTVMPGIAAHDFGDAVRSTAGAVSEDAEGRVIFNRERYEALKEGYLSEAAEVLTPEEIVSLPMGAVVIIYEQALRFLDDYLDLDTYFKIRYPKHNLVRARNQIDLLSSFLCYLREESFL